MRAMVPWACSRMESAINSALTLGFHRMRSPFSLVIIFSTGSHPLNQLSANQRVSFMSM